MPMPSTAQDPDNGPIAKLAVRLTAAGAGAVARMMHAIRVNSRTWAGDNAFRKLAA